jgi:hypothetical protein
VIGSSAIISVAPSRPTCDAHERDRPACACRPSAKKRGRVEPRGRGRQQADGVAAQDQVDEERVGADEVAALVHRADDDVAEQQVADGGRHDEDGHLRRPASTRRRSGSASPPPARDSSGSSARRWTCRTG